MSLPALPTQPADTPWPTHQWPSSEPDVANPDALQAAVDELFESGRPELGRTDALVLVQGGSLVVERYGQGVDSASTLPSWSMAKSMTAVLGALAGIDWEAPVLAPEWVATPDDPRREIRARHLLTMTTGLEWTEIYEPDQPSDVVRMLFGDAKADAARFAADKPPAAAPGEVYQYSSGTTNILARHIAGHLGLDGDAPGFEAFMRRELFDPVGMASPIPKFDARGTFIGSSFCYCTAADFARFGLLCLRGGRWDERQLVPADQIDRFRTPTEASRGVDDFVHGGHFWVHEDGFGTFACHGYEGQYIWMVPALDLVLVRSGVRPETDKQSLVVALRAIVEEFAR